MAQNITSKEAASMVKSGTWIDYGVMQCQPDVFDQALSERIGELQGVNVRAGFTIRPRAILESDPLDEHFHWFNWHFSGYDRKKADMGRASYIPSNLGEIADYYERFIQPPEIVVLKTCPMDSNGFFNFSSANLWHRAVTRRAKLVIVEVTDGMPYVFGFENGVHISEVDYIIEGDHRPVPDLPNPLPTDVDNTVAKLIANEIEDGACLQIGIGGMPNAVCSKLLHSGVRSLGVHTEMLTDGIVELYKAGIITGEKKQLEPGKIVCSFGLGSKLMYETIHRNPDFLCHPLSLTNPPHTIMQNDRVTTINNTTQMDLQGQAASESDGHRHISGTGGQSQFVRGAYASNRGKSFMCMSSTYEKNGKRKSRIVLNLTPGNVVTTTRSDMMYVVTEFGIVNLKGKSVPERAKAMISIAHPEFREDLERGAYESGLLQRGFLS